MPILGPVEELVEVGLLARVIARPASPKPSKPEQM